MSTQLNCSFFHPICCINADACCSCGMRAEGVNMPWTGAARGRCGCGPAGHEHQLRAGRGPGAWRRVPHEGALLLLNKQCACKISRIIRCTCPELWGGLLQSGAAVQQQQLPDLAQGVAAFYHLATGQVLDSRDGLGRVLTGLGFEQVPSLARAAAMQSHSRCHTSIHTARLGCS